MYKKGDSLWLYGSNWLIIHVINESNAKFCWQIITCKWSNFGRSPLWPNQTHTFLVNKKEID